MELAYCYVIGYILTIREGQEKLVGTDASHGCVDFDPTNNCLVQDKHATVTPIQTRELAVQLAF